VTFLSHPLQNFRYYLSNLEDLDVPFNSTLKAVNLPDLQCPEYEGNHPDDEISGQSATLFRCNGRYGVRSTHEACSIFDFLRKKDVKFIKSIKVLDCFVHPHSNLKIKACLKGFDVTCLNWRKRDLSLNLVKEVAPEIKELHLYSSGNEDVLHFWAQTGLSQLKSVRTSMIYSHFNRLHSGTDLLPPLQLKRLRITISGVRFFFASSIMTPIKPILWFR